MSAGRAAKLSNRGNPLALAFYDLTGNGSTVTVEFDDITYTPIPLTDSNGHSYSAVTITVPAGGYTGSSYALLNTVKPDATHGLASLPSTPYLALVKCVTGSVAINTGGTTDGSAGTGGTGCGLGYAPNASTPRQFLAGDYDTFGAQ